MNKFGSFGQYGDRILFEEALVICLRAFFISYLVAPRQTLGYCRRGRLTKPVLINTFDTYSTRTLPGAS